MVPNISGGRGVVHNEPVVVWCPEKLGLVSGYTGKGSILISLGGITVGMVAEVAVELTSGWCSGSPRKKEEKKSLKNYLASFFGIIVYVYICIIL